MANSYRLCTAGVTLRDEINKRWPDRDKTSDGWIGDAAHATRQSDHNPWVVKNGQGIVRAIDVDVDGVDMAWLMEHLRKLGASGDRRLAGGGYLIFNRRITKPDFSGWQAYNGSNPHTSHGHISFTLSPDGFDLVAPWGVADAQTQGDDMAQVPQHEWAQVRDDVRMLKDAFLTRRKPWGGGISNIGVHSEADWQQAEAYDAIQFMLRDNVETHQANVALSRVLNELSDLSARVSALTHALAAMSESQKNS